MGGNIQEVTESESASEARFSSGASLSDLIWKSPAKHQYLLSPIISGDLKLLFFLPVFPFSFLFLPTEIFVLFFIVPSAGTECGERGKIFRDQVFPDNLIVCMQPTLAELWVENGSAARGEGENMIKERQFIRASRGKKPVLRSFKNDKRWSRSKWRRRSRHV